MTTKPTFDSRATTLDHIHQVRDNIDSFVKVMLDRGCVHDASKLVEPEKSVFDEVLPLFEGVAYGSPEYSALLTRMKPALGHHYSANSHHPEHYGADGIAGMDLFDLVEMICDWKAAANRNPADGVKLDHNINLFGIEPQLARILANTFKRWPDADR
jgi:Family of unknown function (DUF5662)